MTDTLKIKPLILIIPIIIAGCDSSNKESYKSKIDRFEKEYAESRVDEGIEQAINLSSNKSFNNVEITTHADFQIPIIYKNKYEELGFDTSKMSFSTPQWYSNQQEFKANTVQENLNASPDQYSHDH